MKTSLCLLAATLLLCGCNSKDPQVAELQSKISVLETRIASLEHDNNEHIYTLGYLSAVHTNDMERVTKLRGDLSELRTSVEIHAAEIDSLHMMVTNLWFAPRK